MAREDSKVPLTENERSMVKLVAQRDGVTEDQAASRLVKDALARRAKKKSIGARITPIKRK